MIARSIYPVPPLEDDASDGQGPATSLPRLRELTNSPAQEYQLRAGQVAPLPNSIAALILCRKGRSKVERHQITVTLDGQELQFASRDSLIIAAKNGTGERVLWALNRRSPDVLHILTEDGRYIESIPRKGEAEWFDHSAASQAAIGDARAHLQRDMARIAEIHAPARAAAEADARHNAAEVKRLIQTFPTCPPSAEAAPRSAFPKADAIERAVENVDAQRAQENVAKERRRKANGDLGKLLGADRTSPPEQSAERRGLEAFL